jgi:hypothetical protein
MMVRIVLIYLGETVAAPEADPVALADELPDLVAEEPFVEEPELELEDEEKAANISVFNFIVSMKSTH